VISRSSLFFFSEELQKYAGMPEPQQAPQPEKKKNFVTKHIGKGTVALGALGAAAALKNPATAGKYLGQMKQMVTNPKAALQRGFRSGASNTQAGTAGASEAASKRIRMYKDVLESAKGGQLQSIKALESGGEGARASGWGSVGSAKSQGERGALSQFFLGKGDPQKLKMSEGLKARVQDAQKTLAKPGGRIDEGVLKGLYTDIQAAGKAQGIRTKKGLTYYAPGERSVMMGLGGGLGGTAGLETHDAETGRKRGIGERLARGTVGAAVGTMASPLFMGRGAGLSSKSYLTGNKAKGFVQGLASQKGVVPLAGSTVALGAGGVAGEVAGKGGELADRAFGQKS
jgi:hypothetical protein